MPNKKLPTDLHMGRNDHFKVNPYALSANFENNPRYLPLEEDRVERLARSIARYGQQEMITIRELYDGKYEPVNGRHRLAAILRINDDPNLRRIAGLEDGAILPILAKIKDCNEEEAIVLSVIENLERKELSPMDKAFIIDKLGRFKEIHEIATLLGYDDTQMVRKLQKLLNLEDRFRMMIHKGEMSIAKGEALLSVAPEERDALLAEAGAASELRRVVRERNGKPSTRTIRQLRAYFVVPEGASYRNPRTAEIKNAVVRLINGEITEEECDDIIDQ